VTTHAKDSLRCACISKILNLPLAIPAPETCCAKCLISCEDSQIFNLVPACTTAICTIVADQRAVTKQQQICVGVEEGPASVASKAVQVPSVASCRASAMFFFT